MNARKYLDGFSIVCVSGVLLYGWLLAFADSV
jgi:hypothetical protein